jgi:hypothetical protein
MGLGGEGEGGAHPGDGADEPRSGGLGGALAASLSVREGVTLLCGALTASAALLAPLPGAAIDEAFLSRLAALSEDALSAFAELPGSAAGGRVDVVRALVCLAVALASGPPKPDALASFVGALVPPALARSLARDVEGGGARRIHPLSGARETRLLFE